jgi:hypothetical protein
MENTSTTPTTADLAARLTIGALKYFAAMSEETNAFTANVLLDGKLIGYADNAGHGGATHVRLIGDNRHDLEIHRRGFEDAVDALVDAKIAEMHDAKFILKMRRKARETTAYITADCKSGQYIAFKKGVMVNLNAVTAKPGFVKFVSDMTDAEILSHFTANA